MNNAAETPAPEPRKRGRPKARITVTCEMCPTKFETIPAELRRGAGRYCSQECRNKAISEKRRAREADEPRQPTVERICDGCGGTFFVYPHRATAARPARFCSRTCWRLRPAERVVVWKRGIKAR